MAFKYVVFAACLAAANAGFLQAPVAYAAGVPAVSSVSSNTVRNFGNTQQVSTYSKSLDTPFSSVRKSDIRVTNDSPALAYAGYAAPAYTQYAAPAYAQTYAAPAYTSYAAPAIAKVAAPVAYHGAYAAPALAHTAYAAPAVAAHPAALGVAYSAAPAVAHYSFDGFGAHYAY
ncbi:pupal cuticle protein C1B-like [Neocloeon triangulifer]|uniref:pupal cuticle protein C1B-like n=1 Tax=Neocloeon triangulifer TaxID=2078957 RepID=UPI00286F2FD8|nr:pupal cuticle protein C1B-like [Neocloeon triangulifer]